MTGCGRCEREKRRLEGVRHDGASPNSRTYEDVADLGSMIIPILLT